MKKIITLLFTALLSFSVFAGEKLIPAVVLQDGCSLFNYDQENNIMEFSKKTVEAGADIKVFTVADENGQIVPELVKSFRYNDKKQKINCNAYHIKYEDKSYYVINNRIALNEKVAVIVKDATIYRSADVADVKDTCIDVGTIISVGPEYQANGKFPMVKITYFVADNYWSTKTGYVLKSKVSTSKDDLKAVRLIKSLSTKKDEAVREEFFKNINKLSTSEGIKIYATNVKESFKEVDFLSEGLTDVYQDGMINCSEGTINVRDVPGTKGNVVGQFKEDTPIFIMQRTNITDTIDKFENYWYLVKSEDETISGWVFGKYVD